MKIDVTERRAKARELFAQGYNCAQAVALTYSDIMNIDPTTVAIMSAPFGGGLSREREVCGAVSGMSMVIGTQSPVTDPTDRDAKSRCYTLAKGCIEEFRAQNGAIVCRELLKLNRRPCSELVECAVEIAANKISNL